MLKSQNDKIQALINALMENSIDFKVNIEYLSNKIDNYDHTNASASKQLIKDCHSGLDNLSSLLVGGNDNDNDILEKAIEKAKLDNTQLDFTSGLNEDDIKELHNSITKLVNDKIDNLALKGGEFEEDAKIIKEVLNETTKYGMHRSLDNLLNNYKFTTLGKQSVSMQHQAPQQQLYEIKSFKLKFIDKNINKKIELTTDYEKMVQAKIDKIEEIQNTLTASAQSKYSELDNANIKLTNIQKIHQENLDEISRNGSKVEGNLKKLDKMNIFKKIFSEEAKVLKQEIKEAKYKIKEMNNQLPSSQNEVNKAKEHQQNCANAFNDISSEQEKNKELLTNYKKLTETTKTILENSQKMKELVPKIDAYNTDIQNLTNAILEKQKELSRLPENSPERINLGNEISQIIDDKTGKIMELDKLEKSYDELNENVISGNKDIESAQKGIDNIYKTSKDMSSALQKSNVMVETGAKILNQAINFFDKLVNVSLNIGLAFIGLGNNTPTSITLLNPVKNVVARNNEITNNSKNNREEDKNIKQTNKKSQGIDLSI